MVYTEKIQGTRRRRGGWQAASLSETDPKMPVFLRVGPRRPWPATRTRSRADPVPSTRRAGLAGRPVGPRPEAQPRTGRPGAGRPGNPQPGTPPSGSSRRPNLNGRDPPTRPPKVGKFITSGARRRPAHRIRRRRRGALRVAKRPREGASPAVGLRALSRAQSGPSQGQRPPVSQALGAAREPGPRSFALPFGPPWPGGPGGLRAGGGGGGA